MISGQQVRDLREKTGLTSEQLGWFLDLDAAQIAYWEAMGSEAPDGTWNFLGWFDVLAKAEAKEPGILFRLLQDRISAAAARVQAAVVLHTIDCSGE